MIAIAAPISQDKIIELLNTYDKDGVKFSFKEKKGLKLYFDVTGTEDLDAAARNAKAFIKAEPWGAVLYFQAEAIK